MDHVYPFFFLLMPTHFLKKKMFLTQSRRESFLESLFAFISLENEMKGIILVLGGLNENTEG